MELKVELGKLVNDWEVNPRKKSNAIIEEYAEYMLEYQEKEVDIETAWNQQIEVTKDLIVVRGGHTLEAMMKVFGKTYEVTVKVWQHFSGKEDAKWLSAQSNIHGKPYNTGERKTAVYNVLSQMHNLKTDSGEDKRAFKTSREIATMLGISPTHVWRLRGQYREENELPSEKDVKEEKEVADEKPDVNPDEAPEVKTNQKIVDEVSSEKEVDVFSITPEQMAEMTEDELRALYDDLENAQSRQRDEYEDDDEEPDETDDTTDESEEPEGESDEGEDDEDDEAEDDDEEEPDESEEPDEKPPKKKAVKTSKTEKPGISDLVTEVDEKEKSDDPRRREIVTERANSIKKSLKPLFDTLLTLNKKEVISAIDEYRVGLEAVFEDDEIRIPASEDNPTDETAWDNVYSLILAVIDICEDEAESWNDKK